MINSNVIDCLAALEHTIQVPTMAPIYASFKRANLRLLPPKRPPHSVKLSNFTVKECHLFLPAKTKGEKAIRTQKSRVILLFNTSTRRFYGFFRQHFWGSLSAPLQKHQQPHHCVTVEYESSGGQSQTDRQTEREGKKPHNKSTCNE